MGFFDSPPPEVKLVGLIGSPYDLSVATARTCYSSQGIITPAEVCRDEKSRALRDKIAASTMEAGHLTTRQHAHFVFALNRVSRQFIWEFLHSHPFYNSEQVSQRYVKVKGGNFLIPTLKPAQKEKFCNVLSLQMNAYEKLIELLLPAVEAEYFRIFKNRKREDKRWKGVVQKKTYEIARYILPIGTQAYLYHTISALTLIRYHKASLGDDVSHEQKFVVSRMIEEVIKQDPDFKKELSTELGADVGLLRRLRQQPPKGAELASAAAPHLPLSSTKAFIQEFDHMLSRHISKLIDYGSNAEESLAQAVRIVLAKTKAQLPDDQAIDAVLNPAKNPELGDTVNLTTLSPLSRALFNVHFTFIKKLSHTADSQNQRHRMTPGTRSILERHYTGEPDVITPKLLEEVSEAKRLYKDVIDQTVESMNVLLKEGVPFEKAHYLIPNGWAVRFEESGDLLNWHHKWKLRTCYNAQEEIFFASVDELKQVANRFPSIGKHILAPCYLRKISGTRPFCPEGDRYCGVPVWNKSINDYNRLI